MKGTVQKYFAEGKISRSRFLVVMPFGNSDVVSVPEGPHENSPAFQRWVDGHKFSSPEGTAKTSAVNSITRSAVPSGLALWLATNAALKRWAIIGCPSGTSTRWPVLNFRTAFFLAAIFVCALFLLAMEGLAAEAPSTNSAPEKSGEFLELLDGSTLHGRLRSIDSDKGLSWVYTDAKQPIEVKPENLGGIRFSVAENATATGSESTCQFRFVNGDEIFGNLLALNETELELQTWFGGKFKTPRAMVRSIRFQPKGATPLYEGPTGREGWQLGRNPNTIGWEYRDGAFIGNSAGTLGRDLKLPDASRIEFDLGWSAPFNLLFSIYTGVTDGFNYNTSSYMYYITPGYISLQRINAGSGSTTMGRSDPIPTMLLKKKVHLEFRANKEENILEVLVDGKPANQWIDTAGWVGKGSGILFYAQTDGAAVKISNIKVYEWDGKPGAEVATNAVSGEDQLHLVNRDKVSGKVTGMRDGKLQFASKEASLEIPLARVTQIFFANMVTNPVAPSPWEIQAMVSGGGTISFALEKWSADKVSGQNKTFGKISLNSRSIRQIRFNPGKSKLTSEEIDPVEDLIWEGDEK